MNEKNGSGQYQPQKTWEFLGEDFWLEDDETEPGRERLIDTESLLAELDIETESDTEDDLDD